MYNEGMLYKHVLNIHVNDKRWLFLRVYFRIALGRLSWSTAFKNIKRDFY